MKQFLLLFLFGFLVIQVNAQSCMPDELYRDSVIGVYPPPASTENPDAGITTSACINAPYEFVFTFKIPAELEISGVILLLDSIVVATEGAVGGLPEGFGYGCNPGSCVFTPEDTLACLSISGIATNPADVGDHMLTITTKIYTNNPLFNGTEVTFPNDLIPGASGEYILTVEDEGSTTCTVGTEDYLTENIRISNAPNPFGNTTNIIVNSKVDEQLELTVYDMLGQVLHRRSIRVFQGENNYEFDGSSLENGIYTYSLTSAKGAVTRSMVISR